MPNPVTNKMLNQLLLDLGFKRGESTAKNNCFWRHPDAGTTVVLPENKMLEPALQADLLSLRARLDYGGHLDAASFDVFVSEGELPQQRRTSNVE